jgi:hypothetical protein
MSGDQSAWAGERFGLSPDSLHRLMRERLPGMPSMPRSSMALPVVPSPDPSAPERSYPGYEMSGRMQPPETFGM